MADVGTKFAKGKLKGKAALNEHSQNVHILPLSQALGKPAGTTEKQCDSTECPSNCISILPWKPAKNETASLGKRRGNLAIKSPNK